MPHALAPSALVRVARAVATYRDSRAARGCVLVPVAGEKSARARAFDPEFVKKRPSRAETRNELRVTSTNDLVDAVIRRALRPGEPDTDSSLGAFGDEDEPPGTRHADDTELLDALLSRAGEVTAYEASDVLHAVSRSARFQKLEVPRGRLLDAFARLDGPFDAIQRIYLDESAPSAWTSPRREETDAPPWIGAPYGYTVRDIARVAYALASFPRATDQSAAENRLLLTKAAAHIAARFSRDEWTREHAAEGDLVTLAWAFSEILSGLGDDGPTRKACRRAMRELSHPVRRHAAAFSAEQICVVACAYERAYEDCAIGGAESRTRGAGAADGRATANCVLQALAPRALRRASEFSAEQLRYVSDACARFGVHPKGEGTWNWNAVVLERRREESEARRRDAEKKNA